MTAKIAGILAASLLAPAGTAHAQSPDSQSPIEVLETKVISKQPELYSGWSTVTKLKSGELVLVYSGGRDEHVCPMGRVEIMRSKDQGENWTWPQVLYDGPIDDRDAGILETSNGTILVTTFTSLAYQPLLERARAAGPGEPGAFTPERLAKWNAVEARTTPEERKKELGTFVFRSTDGGINWDERYSVPCNSPHGPTELADGRLLYAGKALWGTEEVGVWESKDDGIHWELLSSIPTRDGDNPKEYHELHAVQATNGSVIVQVRNHNANNSNETLQTESHDGGKTWTPLKSIGVWGLPSHLLVLNSGRLLMTYGHRRAPLGNQVRYSDDHGQTWSDAIVLTGDAVSGDLGYPSTIEKEDGTLLTVWYEKMKDLPKAQLRQAHWKFN